MESKNKERENQNEILPSDYYIENNRVVFTEEYHIRRGHCCGSYNGCRHCPYEPTHKRGNQIVQDKYLATKEEIDIFKSKSGYDNTLKGNNQ